MSTYNNYALRRWLEKEARVGYAGSHSKRRFAPRARPARSKKKYVSRGKGKASRKAARRKPFEKVKGRRSRPRGFGGSTRRVRRPNQYTNFQYGGFGRESADRARYGRRQQTTYGQRQAGSYSVGRTAPRAWGTTERAYYRMGAPYGPQKRTRVGQGYAVPSGKRMRMPSTLAAYARADRIPTYKRKHAAPFAPSKRHQPASRKRSAADMGTSKRQRHGSTSLPGVSAIFPRLSN